jgi:hypothetical protein
VLSIKMTFREAHYLNFWPSTILTAGANLWI